MAYAVRAPLNAPMIAPERDREHNRKHPNDRMANTKQRAEFKDLQNRGRHCDQLSIEPTERSICRITISSTMPVDMMAIADVWTRRRVQRLRGVRNDRQAVRQIAAENTARRYRKTTQISAAERQSCPACADRFRSPGKSASRALPVEGPDHCSRSFHSPWIPARLFRTALLPTKKPRHV